jgi:hypothetical protein
LSSTKESQFQFHPKRYAVLETNKNEYIKYDVACIPNIKTSIQMNSLFRCIKENNNLDSLEESDDEEEFEDEDENKFVHLDKVYNMVCEYNYKFKKWIPIRVASEDATVSSKNDIQFVNKSYNYKKY